MQPLYIVHALPFFDPATRFGGPIAQLRRVCRCLAQRDHQVRVVATEGIGPDLAREQCRVVEANTEAVANALGKMLADRRHLPTMGEKRTVARNFPAAKAA